MIGHAMVGTRDLVKATVFHDPILEEMGLGKTSRNGQEACWDQTSRPFQRRWELPVVSCNTAPQSRTTRRLQ